ncbi:MAG: hypothetical protein WD749_13230 [Phycisphaerales bacterium]
MHQSLKLALSAGMALACASAAHAQFPENFDTTTAGTLPGGWVANGFGPGSPWTVVSDQSNSFPNSVFTNDQIGVGSQFLDTPPINALGPVTIDLWRRFNTESTFDGWVIESSINGSPFTNIGEAAFRTGPYNATISANFQSPIGGQRAFSGAATTWTRSTAVIPAQSGDAVTIRFHMATDSSVSSTGVWLDDISVTTSATAVCCKSDGTCELLGQAACASAGGIFNIVAESCATANCPMPAACCAASGTCSMALPSVCTAGGGAYQGVGSDCGSVTCAGAFFEIEPNETRPGATAVSFFTPGNFIQGNTTGSSGTAIGAPTSLDQFLVTTANLNPGVYRHRLTITTTGAAGHTGSIRGLTQTAALAGPWAGAVGTATAADTQLQGSLTTTTPPRMNQWYGFGKQEKVYYRVIGTGTTTGDYQATWTADPVSPSQLGFFIPGQVTISTVAQGHTTDTDFWVYGVDGGGDLVAIDGSGNDGSSLNGGAPANNNTPSWLTRAYDPGTYYLAMSNFNLANNKGSPSDDNFRTGALLDFPDALLTSSSTANVNCAFAVTDSAGTTQFAATKPAAFDVLWFRFDVLPLTAVGACCKTDGSCDSIALGDCLAAGGIFRGENVACAAANCPPPGACCLADGTCLTRTGAACVAAGGAFAGDNTACATAGCVPADPTPLPLAYNWNGMVSEFSEQGEANRQDLNGYRSVADRGLLVNGAANAINATPVIAGSVGLGYTVNDQPHTLDIVHLGDRRTVANAARNWNPPSTNIQAGAQPSWLLENDQTTPQVSPLSAAGVTLSPHSRIGVLYQISDSGGRFDCTLTFTDNSSVTVTLRAADWFSNNNPQHPAPGAGSGLEVQRKLGRYGATQDTDLANTTATNDLDVVEAVFSVPRLIADGLGNHAGKTLASITFSNPISNANYANSTPATGSGHAILAASVSFPGAGAPPCYANCDNSTQPPVLNVADFGCFLTRYAAGDAYANCDNSTQPPVLNVADFGCFLTKYAAGCP